MFALLTNSVSAHQLPLARELVKRLGAEHFRYVYTGELQHGAQETECDEPWIVRWNREPSAIAELLENCETLLCGNRDVALMEKRARNGLTTLYMSERWFKPKKRFIPGWVRLLHPGYLRMCLRMRRLLRSGAVRYLAVGPHAAADMSLVSGLTGFVRWGYWVEPSSSNHSDQTIEQFKQSNNAFRVLWVGRMLDWKRVDTIIRAVGTRRDEDIAPYRADEDNARGCEDDGRARCPHRADRYDIELTIVGNGPEEMRLKRLAERSAAKITFVDAVPLAEVRRLMREHDLYVLASDATEGWGAVVNEAIEEGMDVVGTFEAGASAALLPKNRLFHAGDFKALARRIVERAAARDTADFAAVREWMRPSAAADRLLTIAHPKAPRIIHVAAGIQETCGVSQFVVNIAREQQRAGARVTIITSMTCGFPVEDLDVRLVGDPREALDDIAAEEPTLAGAVVHIHSMWMPYLHRAAVWCRARAIRYLWSPHGSMTPWAMKYHWWKKLPAWFLYQRRDLALAAAFHATVPDEEDDIRRYGFSQKVIVAPLGAAVAENGATAAKMPRSNDVLFLSRIHPKKNIGALIEAWKLVSAADVGRLIISGSDDVGEQARLVTLAKSLELVVVDFSRDLEFGKKQIGGGGEVPVESFEMRLAEIPPRTVVFTGPVYAAARDWMYSRAKMLVLPSHSENFGGVVVESLAQGTPVIASRGTPWESLESAAVGRWIEPQPTEIAAAIDSVFSMSVEDYDGMCSRAVGFVRERFSWTASARTITESLRVGRGFLI